MQCVYYEDRQPDGFEEHFFFCPEMPYTIRVKSFPAEEIVPLHYAQTVEVLLCEDLCGEIVIDNRRFPLAGRQLFVIPPYTVHANSVRPCGGTMLVLKIDVHEMDRYFSSANFLALRGCQLGQLQYLCPEYDAARSIVEGLIRRDGDLMGCLPLVLELLEVLSRHVEPRRGGAGSHTRFKSSSLQELIRWTNENYARKITIGEVAAMTGYSKYHFCSRFKAQTGMTYMRFLNSVRVSQACLMLSNGESVQEAGRNCGFEDTSHFIQVFKSVQHMTPRQYALQRKAHPPEVEI